MLFLEWIGPAVVSYLAKELILGYGTNKKITRLVDQFEFTIVPVLNADGYAYTWEHNRMWRKNREPTFVPFCPGIVSVIGHVCAFDEPSSLYQILRRHFIF